MHIRRWKKFVPQSVAALGALLSILLIWRIGDVVGTKDAVIEYTVLWIVLAFIIAEFAARSGASRFFSGEKMRSRWLILFWCTMIVTAAVALLERWAELGLAHLRFQYVPIVAVLWALTVRFLPRGGVRMPKKMQWKSWWWLLAAVFVVWGSWIRIAAIDSHVLQGDEYFHVNTGMGYAQTGEFVQWDWLRDQPRAGKKYTRAWPYTWQVAQSINLFGESEAALRLPALLWGLLFLAALPLCVALWTRSVAIGAYVAGFAAFDPTLIWLSTFSRMYTMLFAVVLAVAMMLWRAVASKTLSRHDSAERWLWLLGAFVLSAASYVIHPVAALLLPVLCVSVIVAWSTHRAHRWFRHAAFLSIAAGIVGVVVAVFFPFSDLHFLTIRAVPQVQYASYIINAALVPVVAGALFVGGTIHVWRRQAPLFVRLLTVVIWPVLTYFVFFANRYAAKKYFAFVLFAAFVLMAWMWHRVMQKAVASQRAAAACGVALFFIVLVPFSIPGVDVPLATNARSDRSYVALAAHDYVTLYAYLDDYAQPGDVYLLQGTKHYYLTRADVRYERISLQTPLTRERIEDMFAKHEHGWIALSRRKNDLVDAEARAFIRKNANRIQEDELRKANFIVYRW